MKPLNFSRIVLLALVIPGLFVATYAFVNQQKTPRRRSLVHQASSEKRYALVIGNGLYTNSPLKNPPNDARDMAAALTDVGFEVLNANNCTNLSQRQMKQLIREFGQRLRGGGVGLFFYAGHGVQAKGHNYLIPVDADIESEAELVDRAVDVDLVLNYMEEAGNGLNIIILDACRNNPFGRSYRSAANGLAVVEAPTGTLIAYATGPNRVASDGSGRNGLYSGELLRQLRAPGLEIGTLLRRVGGRVSEATGRKQEPWVSSNVYKDFYFVPPGAETLNSSAGSKGALRRSVQNQVGMELMLIPPGRFQMGSSTGGDSEKPVHTVTIRYPFYIGRTEVTQSQWESVMENNPSQFKGDNLPVQTVSWDDAQAFIQKLNQQNDGYSYRLPSEAEWEYACRGGSTGDYAGDLEAMAWYDGNSDNKTHPVGTKAPNNFGLYDMHGNVWEWCADWHHTSYKGAPIDGSAWVTGGDQKNRVWRGGSWALDPFNLRSSARYGGAPDERSNYVGFRVVAVPQV